MPDAVVVEAPNSSEINSLYLNALAAIRVGVADYLTDEDERLSSGVRNLIAGLLLLCKEKLRRLSPPDSNGILIYEQIEPARGLDGSVAFRPRGKRPKTVTRDQIERRLRALGIKADFKALGRAIDVRNDLEHLYIPASLRLRCREAFADGYAFLDRFMREALGADPAAAIGPQTWATLLREHTIETRAQEECAASFQNVVWTDAPRSAKALLEAMVCNQCGSSLLSCQVLEHSSFFGLPLACRACGAGHETAELIEEALHQEFGAEWHIHLKDGGDDPCGECEECGRDAYVFSENICYACGEEAPHYDQDYEDYLADQADAAS